MGSFRRTVFCLALCWVCSLPQLGQAEDETVDPVPYTANGKTSYTWTLEPPEGCHVESSNWRVWLSFKSPKGLSSELFAWKEANWPFCAQLFGTSHGITIDTKDKKRVVFNGPISSQLAACIVGSAEVEASYYCPNDHRARSSRNQPRQSNSPKQPPSHNTCKNKITWCLDMDMDGYGDPLKPYYQKQCTQPPNWEESCSKVFGFCGPKKTRPYVNNCLDHCDHAKGPTNPDPWCRDADGDGKGYINSMTIVGSGDGCIMPSYSSGPWIQNCDDHCDQDPDADTQTMWSFDNDGDGKGKDGTGTFGCRPGPKWVTVGGDKCDDHASTFEPSKWYPDKDKDNLGENVPPTISCGPPDNLIHWTLTPGDKCDDVFGADAPDTWYEDKDGDGVGSLVQYGETISTCTPPEGNWAPVSGDACDNNPETTEKITFYKDLDGDGIPKQSVSKEFCSAEEAKLEQFIAPTETLVQIGGISIANEMLDIIGLKPAPPPSKYTWDKCDEHPEVIEPQIYYTDSDGDGVGIGDPLEICHPEPAKIFVPYHGDCDDLDDEIGQFVTVYEDLDQDYLGDPERPAKEIDCAVDDYAEEIIGWHEDPDDLAPLEFGATPLLNLAQGAGRIFIPELSNESNETFQGLRCTYRHGQIVDCLPASIWGLMCPELQNAVHKIDLSKVAVTILPQPSTAMVYECLASSSQAISHIYNDIEPGKSLANSGMMFYNFHPIGQLLIMKSGPDHVANSYGVDMDWVLPATYAALLPYAVQSPSQVAGPLPVATIGDNSYAVSTKKNNDPMDDEALLARRILYDGHVSPRRHVFVPKVLETANATHPTSLLNRPPLSVTQSWAQAHEKLAMSDGDLLPDKLEKKLGLSHMNDDTDGDGNHDDIEYLWSLGDPNNAINPDYVVTKHFPSIDGPFSPEEWKLFQDAKTKAEYLLPLAIERLNLLYGEDVKVNILGGWEKGIALLNNMQITTGWTISADLSELEMSSGKPYVLGVSPLNTLGKLNFDLQTLNAINASSLPYFAATQEAAALGIAGGCGTKFNDICITRNVLRAYGYTKAANTMIHEVFHHLVDVPSIYLDAAEYEHQVIYDVLGRWDLFSLMHEY